MSDVARHGAAEGADSTRDQVIALLSDPEHQAWLQNMQTQFAKGELQAGALKTLAEYDSLADSQQR